jgi:hypothetical protein
MSKTFILAALLILFLTMCTEKTEPSQPVFELKKSTAIYFKSFVDCNMAEAWIGDTFRIFPGKYGEDPLWGYSNELKYADGKNVAEVFNRKFTEFVPPSMPKNVSPTALGLHGAVWFETIYQDKSDPSGKTLYALYHNENYPETLPYNHLTGKGYINYNWPEGLTGKTTPAAVCRIGIMKSINGGHSWENKGIILEDNQDRMILKPYNNSVTFAGGVGDPSAVVSGEYLYIFYGEYGYADKFDSLKYNPNIDREGQCISMARIKLTDLDAPTGKAKRWDGKNYTALYDGIGKPIQSLQIPIAEGGGPTSNVNSKYYWGPSVSWNSYLHAWVMLMAKSEGASWKGSSIYISFNQNEVFDDKNSQQWSKPQLVLTKPGSTLWYPALQPFGDSNAAAKKLTTFNLGETARLFYKDQTKDTAVYVSEFEIRFKKQ